VNVKAIVIGLMNRLSAYAARESESEPLEKRRKIEEVAVEKLMKRLRLKDNANNAGSQLEALDSRRDEEEEPRTNGTLTKDASTDASTDDKPSPSEDVEASKPSKQRSIPEDVKLYEVFYEQVVNLVNAQRLAIHDTIALLVSLANLALSVFPCFSPFYSKPRPEKLRAELANGQQKYLSRSIRYGAAQPTRTVFILTSATEYVDQVLSYAHEKVTQHTNSPDLHSAPTQTNLLNLLLAPIKTYVSLFTTLSLPNYLPLLHAQTYPTRRAVATQVSHSLLQSRIKISTLKHLEGVLEILRVLVKEGSPQPTGYSGVQVQRRGVETEETIEEQGQLARIVHLINSDDNDTQFQVDFHTHTHTHTQHLGGGSLRKREQDKWERWVPRLTLLSRL
jgi:vacuolar protein sorting-associated protein 35